MVELVEAGRDDGCVMAQLAACRHAVGVALVPVAVWEARGPRAALDRMLLDNSRACWLRLAMHRAVAMVDVPGLPRPEGAIAASFPDIAVSAHPSAFCALVLAGPRAARLAASAGPALRPRAVFGEGDELRLLVVARRDGPAALSALLTAGREDGAIAVDRTVLGLLRAARRVNAGQRAVPIPVSLRSLRGSPIA